jgi:queuine tRNA-ribosyltransferase
MNWPGPILTDSGGFQVMSLAALRKITERGVTFQSHIDGSSHELTPERAVEIQRQLDATITMVLDECTPFPSDEKTASDSMRRSMRWAQRCRDAFDARSGYGLFGIVQGSIYADLRADHAEQLRALDFDGYAIGGLAVGEDKDATWTAMEAAAAELPADKPRYVMGMGTPADLVEGVARGIDLFDCVMPTRHARNGMAFTREGRIAIKNQVYADDQRPLDADCRCPTCRRHSRAYLRHLQARRDMNASIYLTWHNLFHYLDSMRGIRHAIASARFADFRRAAAARLADSSP